MGQRTEASGQSEDSHPAAPSERELLRRALLVAAVGAATVAGLVMVGPRATRGAAAAAPSVSARAALPSAPVPTASAALASSGAASAVSAPAPREPSPCSPRDPLGLGPWSAYEPLSLGEVAIPQRGGHTADHGYDVLIHFHGHEAARKYFVQASRGAVFVGVDLGVGSGAYSKAFPTRGAFERFVAEIEAALRRRHPQAHVRHLGLSAWSAGYGAIGEILLHGAPQVSAVLLLDGLHAAWRRGPVPSPRVEDLSDRTLGPFLDFARRALAGQARFAFTHSQIEPPGYPGTAPTAALLLARLGLVPRPVAPSPGDDTLLTEARQAGVLVWSQRGDDAPAHCAHLANLVPLVRDFVEPVWQTPALERGVPSTPAPPRQRPGARSEPGRLELELLPSPGPRRPEADAHDGLEPIPLAGPGEGAESAP